MSCRFDVLAATVGSRRVTETNQTWLVVAYANVYIVAEPGTSLR